MEPIARLYASELFPVSCPKCGGLSGIRGLFAGSYLAIVEFLVIGMLLLMFGNSPTVKGTLILAAFTGANVLVGLAGTLQPLTLAQTKLARRFVLFLVPPFLVFAGVGLFRG